MTERVDGRPDPRRAQVRRHRRERQIMVFGGLFIAVAFSGLFAAGVYTGDIEGPFSEAFVTPEGAIESDVTLVCPPSDTLPAKPWNVGFRVLNGTDATGLAGDVAATLEERDYVLVSTGNWGRTYEDNVRLYFGPEAVREAYTLARQFQGDVDLVLDNREGTLVDVVLGTAYAEEGAMLEASDPALDMAQVLTTSAECLPASVIEPEPAPRELPANPVDEESEK